MVDYQRVKRLFDCIAAAFGLLLCSGLIAVTALLVLIFHGLPVLFAQERVTKDGRVFHLRKFRSMRPFDPSRGWTSDETRLTGFGRLLRATSLDELPELWNVLVGDMSIIGPRPLTTDYLQLYTPQQARRHEVRGGLSGLAQVSGRNALSWDEKFDLDVEYVDSLSLMTDLRVSLRTVGTVLGRQGVEVDEVATTDSFGGSLRSELVIFEPVSRTRELTEWAVRTVGGAPIGRCAMLRIDEVHRIVRIDPTQEGRGTLTGQPVVYAEVLRLLINRARGANADLALCPIPSVGSAAAAYAAAGFRTVPPELEASISAALTRHTQQQPEDEGFLYCDLYPDEATNENLRLAS
ncbi:Sugar transferase involved in LPS biosynthesis (colanic, teichoic acid) [Brevibacterium sandarakinum]|uniref:Sugar transferase involved in LPS biosynthesis (Colanic, teichoic acid) n=1 Tax=Brevibacterium sandarakinum TaxID=629680 RepID=A0A1H1TD10_BRESA|nr:sugar transferase [Brevibacterium sandarakinum]SDS57941.1 Sugar transferase involved in LPS biosynthesis (colanic, teichoic acid) [Brevibacterium sandarakinum]